MSKLDTVRALISKAGHSNTPIDEARTTALQAVKMILKHNFKIVESLGSDINNNVPFPDDDYDIPDFFDQSKFVEIEPFKHEVAKHNMTCAKCGKEIRKGQTYARETQTKIPRMTHYECRSLFTNKG